MIQAEPTETIVSPKQGELMDAIRSRQYDLIYLIGAIGTSKTYGQVLALVQICLQYPGSFVPIGRKTLAEARLGTWQTVLEVIDNCNLEEGVEYTKTEGNELKIKFKNKSIIQIVPIDQSKDRQWTKIKSINATAAGVDEVDAIVLEGFVTFASRTGRRNSNGAPGVTIVTCNPNETWVKELVYTPWRQGKLPPRTLVIEFQMEDSFLYRSGYYERFELNPPQWKQRYLNNNWEYLDDDNSLFKSRVLDAIYVQSFDESLMKVMGVDVAREGKDRSVVAKIVGKTLVDIKIYTREEIERLAKPDERDAPPYNIILGREVYKYAMREEIGYSHSACDAVGNGGGVVDYLRSIQFKINEFKAGERSEENFNMMRSEMAFKLAKDMEKGEFFFWEGCPFLSELKQELLYHLYTTEDKMVKVESKELMKKRLGKSPDIADAVMIAYYNLKRLPDSRFNLNRIGL